MFSHKWFYQGKVLEIIDGQTFVIWIDLGFEIWKKVPVRFNRLKMKDLSGPLEAIAFKYLEQNLKGKKIYCQIFKTTGPNKFDRYFGEIYTPPGDISMKLKDINKNIADTHRIDGLINFNDLMVSQGFSTYMDFHKKGNHAQIPVHNGPARQPANVRNNSGRGLEKGPQIDSSGGRSPTQE